MIENSLKLYKVNPDYCDYLRKYDYRVPMNSGERERRPFVGIVLEISGIYYYASLTSPKKKHLTMSNAQDFIKINGGIWGAINLNNMIPINMIDLIPINLTINPDDDKETVQYKKLLENQRKWCNSKSDVIRQKAKKLHTIITMDKSTNIALIERCCNYKLLEVKYVEYCVAKGLV